MSILNNMTHSNTQQYDTEALPVSSTLVYAKKNEPTNPTNNDLGKLQS
jgi:hypothetical protein